jgi:hypothetical protein
VIDSEAEAGLEKTLFFYFLIFAGRSWYNYKIGKMSIYGASTPPCWRKAFLFRVPESRLVFFGEKSWFDSQQAESLRRTRRGDS